MSNIDQISQTKIATQRSNYCIIKVSTEVLTTFYSFGLIKFDDEDNSSGKTHQGSNIIRELVCTERTGLTASHFCKILQTHIIWY